MEKHHAEQQKLDYYYRKFTRITVVYDDVECEVIFDQDNDPIDIAIGGVYCGQCLSGEFQDKVETLAKEKLED